MRKITRRSDQQGAGILLFWILALGAGVPALVLAGLGWIEVRGVPATPEGWIDWAVRTAKVLLLSDIYFDPDQIKTAIDSPFGTTLEWARTLGVTSSVILAGRLAYFAIVERVAEFWLRGRRRHVVVVGAGPAAIEYPAATSVRKVTHLSGESKPRGDYAQIRRVGSLQQQLDAAAGKHARRILVDEGDDSDTWASAQVVARHCRNSEVLAHISDPWMLDRLSREDRTFGLVAFSYATGAARQVMLAHPPYLLAKRLKADVQHILILGFGQVGQAIAREFIVTSLAPSPEKMMVTVIDIDADRLKQDFTARHPEIGGHVDFAFVQGDFRLNDAAVFEALAKRCAGAEVCAAYVAIDDERRPLSLAFAVQAVARQKQLFRGPVFICAQHGAGLSTSVRQGAGLVGASSDPAALKEIENRAEAEDLICDLRVVSFGSWTDAFDGAGLQEPELDGQAKKLHAAYQRLTTEQAKARNPGGVLPETPKWEALADQLRISNRRSAAHIRAKAYAADFDLDGWLQDSENGHGAWELPPARDRFNLEDAALADKLARLEHRRWMLDRLLDGWRLGPRNDYTRHRDDLVPFEQLDAEARAKDSMVVATAAAMLGGTRNWRGSRKSPG